MRNNLDLIHYWKSGNTVDTLNVLTIVYAIKIITRHFAIYKVYTRVLCDTRIMHYILGAYYSYFLKCGFFFVLQIIKIITNYWCTLQFMYIIINFFRQCILIFYNRSVQYHVECSDRTTWRWYYDSGPLSLLCLRHCIQYLWYVFNSLYCSSGVVIKKMSFCSLLLVIRKK